MKESRPSTFRFKRFEISDSVSAMKIGTDGVILGAWAFESYSPKHILDVGAGTGLISLMMAQRFSSATIDGIEIDERAASEARQNVAASPWYDRVGIVAADFTECKSLKADAIVSNPPFFTSGILASDPHRADARHEGSLSVDSLLDGAAEIMDQRGRLAVIIPFERLDKTVYSAAIRRLDACRIAELASNPASQPIRVMIEFTKGLADTFSRERIDIRSEAGSFSSRYAELTSEFYL